MDKDCFSCPPECYSSPYTFTMIQPFVLCRRVLVLLTRQCKVWVFIPKLHCYLGMPSTILYYENEATCEGAFFFCLCCCLIYLLKARSAVLFGPHCYVHLKESRKTKYTLFTLINASRQLLREKVQVLICWNRILYRTSWIYSCACDSENKPSGALLMGVI